MLPKLLPRIAIPLPHSSDPEYAERSIPQYENAVKIAGGEPVRIPLDRAPAELMKIIESCDGILLPGSKADVDAAKFGAPRSSHTTAADPRRDTIDELLLQDAYNLRKPILGICYGLQSLNVYRSGSLIQHIPDFLPEDLRAQVNHEAGKNVAVAHQVRIENDSRLAKILSAKKLKGYGLSPAENSGKSVGALAPEGDQFVIPVNSSHHQSAAAIGNGLRVSAHCIDDGIVEALEGTAPDHFVIAVQWHPERSIDQDEPSRAIFRALVKAAVARRQQLRSESESVK
ncbi:MAG: gamma-glutamyl-gamma-aminobutyrate hydrolase family protein [Candidatus Sulfotelmatobacter sp.]